METNAKHDNSPADEWDVHWNSLEQRRSVFSLVALAVRRFVFQPSVAHYFRTHFSTSGVFVEAGCGSAESSNRIEHHGRRLVGLDFSDSALKSAQRVGRMDALVQGDVFALPFRSQSVDGIWNLGVMEHFTQEQLRSCLREFRRVLKPGGVILLFWPTEYNSSRWILGPLEVLISRWRQSAFTFFPGEISRLHSKDQVRNLMEREGFRIIEL